MIKPESEGWIFWVGFFLLLIPGTLYAYLLMPFPGSQDLNAITICYYLAKIILPLRVAGSIMVVIYLVKYFTVISVKNRIVKILALLIFGFIFYVSDVQYKAEKMFEEPKTIRFADAIQNKVPESMIVLGVVNNGVAKAYPLNYLGYHHKIQDDVGGEPVLVTYCTMCRTGRVFSPIINGKHQQFRLVGARHYNAVIEDGDTKSWWYQATGIAAAGPLKGERLKELYYEQSTLESWFAKHPTSLVLQPDDHYINDYNDLKNYDRLQAIDKDSSIRNKDTLIRKSWVLGTKVNGIAKAYNWRTLTKSHIINDKIGAIPVLVGVENDNNTCHAYKRMVASKELNFSIDTAGYLTDRETQSTWNWDGVCISGINKGKQLEKLHAYQEYLHSWKHFHPATLFE